MRPIPVGKNKDYSAAGCDPVRESSIDNSITNIVYVASCPCARIFIIQNRIVFYSKEAMYG
ncbi:hypothetical protein BLA28_29020 [Eisenbergiella tayi]|uniref:Uncharacterized protein n=1 Tax=Eisenbergiella tayi TaxID=1432052 RepID=A0A1E3UFD6_9FIRM|nr:hypothetical protein BEI60_11865 [Eisenbergiella tayi]RJW36670.1 hypothetical protein DXC97_19105 [Lachnospiraceae bacterium TF09-5]RJW43475.1 hypothetical protein DXB25_25545 [Lachnospiraceae bacterium OM02-31]RJW55035.1 hypothetical protein DXB24_22670 [Lachnospiraceae bacterium OM02-3]ODR40813.1 hypothetical protein BEI62_14470 [Eisenbergiella tayi]